MAAGQLFPPLRLGRFCSQSDERDVRATTQHLQRVEEKVGRMAMNFGPARLGKQRERKVAEICFCQRGCKAPIRERAQELLSLAFVRIWQTNRRPKVVWSLGQPLNWRLSRGGKRASERASEQRGLERESSWLGAPRAFGRPESGQPGRVFGVLARRRRRVGELRRGDI